MPTTDIVTRAREAINPLTGEIVDLAAATTTDLAVERDEIRAARDRLGTWAKAVDAELTARLDKEAKRSATVGDYKLQVTGPTVKHTDEVGGRAAMLKLVEEGVLSEAAVDAAFEEVPTIKARRRGINALHKHADPRVRETIAQYDRDVENPTRRVTVNRILERG